ncbi:MAG TPA: tetratricopeptide repeat protein, partial [Ktedonobacterales bacterium]
ADLSSLGQVSLHRGDLDAAATYLQESLSIVREMQDRHGEGVVLSSLGQVALLRRDLDAATTAFQQSLPLLHETHDRQGEGAVLSGLALIAESRDDLAAAERFHRESLQRNSEAHEAGDIATSLEVLGTFLLTHQRGHAGEGCELLAMAATRWRDLGRTDNARRASEEALRLGCHPQQ